MSRIAGLAIAVSVLASTAASAYDDATVLAVELSDSLLAPPVLEARIALDLGAVRAADPRMAALHARPDWALGEVLVRLDGDACSAFEAGGYAPLDSLNALLGAVACEPLH
jgi:hypothetical protein